MVPELLNLGKAPPSDVKGLGRRGRCFGYFAKMLDAALQCLGDWWNTLSSHLARVAIFLFQSLVKGGFG